MTKLIYNKESTRPGHIDPLVILHEGGKIHIRVVDDQSMFMIKLSEKEFSLFVHSLFIMGKFFEDGERVCSIDQDDNEVVVEMGRGLNNSTIQLFFTLGSSIGGICPTIEIVFDSDEFSVFLLIMRLFLKEHNIEEYNNGF